MRHFAEAAAAGFGLLVAAIYAWAVIGWAVWP